MDLGLEIWLKRGHYRISGPAGNVDHLTLAAGKNFWRIARVSHFDAKWREYIRMSQRAEKTCIHGSDPIQ